RQTRSRAAPAVRLRGTQPDQPTADSGRAVPAALRSRRGDEGGDQVNALAGTRSLIRLALRRDRVLLPVWLAVFAGMAALSAQATIELYPTVESRVSAATATNSTPSLVALYGRVYDPTSLGAVSMIKLGGMGAAMVAVLTIIIVVRHSRAEEESGRAELLGSTVVGRYAPLTAALLVGIGTNVALGVL